MAITPAAYRGRIGRADGWGSGGKHGGAGWPAVALSLRMFPASWYGFRKNSGDGRP